MSTSETAPSPEDGEDVAPLTEPLLSPSVDGEDEESGLSVAPTSSLPAALSNVVMAVLGAGQLTLPYVMSQLGFAFGMLLLVCFALVAVYSSALLRALTASTKAATYGDMLGRALGPRWKTACAVVVVLYAFGTAVSYFLIIREQLHRIAAFFLPTSDTGATPWEENKVFMLVVVTALVVYPLSALRDLTALRFSSSLGSLFALYITSVVCLYAPWGADRHHIREDDGGVVLLRVCRGGHPPSPDLAPRLWPRSFAAFAAASPLLAFALNSGWAFVPVFASLRDPTPSRGATLILVSHAIIAVNYLIIAGVGYASYCDSVEDNVVDSLPTSSAPALAARAALVFQLCCGLPLRFHVIAGAILPPESRRGGGDGDGDGDDGDGDDGEGDERQIDDELTRRGSPFGSTRWVATQTILVPVTMACACVATELHVVVGLTAAVCASCIIYIFPGVATLAGAGGEVASRRKTAAAGGLLAMGLFVMTAGTWANAMDAARGRVGGAS